MDAVGITFTAHLVQGGRDARHVAIINVTLSCVSGLERTVEEKVSAGNG